MKANSWLRAALVALAGGWIYFPALHGAWLWDDRLDITGNSVMRDPAGLWKIWFAPQSLDYYPLKASVQWIQWRLWGMDTFGYHVTNLGLHLLSGFLIWGLMRRLGARFAWLGGLIFVIHPLAVESVAWIVELKNTLSLPLLLGALGAFLAYDEARSRRSYLAALLLFLAAMLSKTSVVMFPFVILLYAWWKRGRIARGDLKASAPFFAVSLVLGLVTVWLQQHRTIGSAVIPMGGFLSRLAGAGMTAGFYFWKFIMPVGLSPVYWRWNVDPPSPVQFLPCLVIAGIIWLLLRLRARAALFGLGFFLLNLAPVLGFVTVSFMRFTSMMDHLAYLPMVGLAGLAAAGVGRVRATIANARHAALFWAFVTGVLIALAIGSRRHAEIFRDEETLWRCAVQRSPDAWPAHANLGIALSGSGHLAEAIAQYEEALRLDPGSAETHFNLGIALGKAGRLPEAIAQYETATKLQPDFLGAYFSLGDALAATGRLPEAVARYQDALRIEPRHVEARNNLGNTLRRMGRLPEAIAEFQEALRLRPDDAEARNNLGVALAEEGRLPEAILQFKEALRIRPDYANARENLDRALGMSGR